MSDYEREAAQLLQRAFNSDLRILVWGPGDPGPTGSAQRRAAYAKRVQIRDELRSRFPNAGVYFSEDPEMVELTKDVREQLRKQALQARVSDLTIMLDIGRGVDLELDHFVKTYPWFRSKAHVFLPANFVNTPGLVAEVLQELPRQNVEGYSKAEYKRCDVARRKAVEVAHGLALDKVLSE